MARVWSRVDYFCFEDLKRSLSLNPSNSKELKTKIITKGVDFNNFKIKSMKNKVITVIGVDISILQDKNNDYISLTDMLKAKDGDFFISDWLRNRNTVEFLGIWESVYNPTFNYGEFAIIKSQAGLK